MNDAGNMFGRICLAVLKGEINRKWQRFKYPGREVIFWWTQGPWSACWSRRGSASSHAWCGPRAHWTGSQRQPSWTLWWGWIGGPWSAPLSAGRAPVPEQTSSPLLCSSSCRSQGWCCRLSESRHGWGSYTNEMRKALLRIYLLASHKPVCGCTSIMFSPNHLHSMVKLISLTCLDEEQLWFSC